MYELFKFFLQTVSVPTECICNRKIMGILCRSCGNVFRGRVRQICRCHPNSRYLMDYEVCPVCKATQFREFEEISDMECEKERNTWAVKYIIYIFQGVVIICHMHTRPLVCDILEVPDYKNHSILSFVFRVEPWGVLRTALFLDLDEKIRHWQADDEKVFIVIILFEWSSCQLPWLLCYICVWIMNS
jgi:hypothetical protein